MELKTVSSIRKMGYIITLPREKSCDLLRNIIIPKIGKDETIRLSFTPIYMSLKNKSLKELRKDNNIIQYNITFLNK